jgi:hypothetical protein
MFYTISISITAGLLCGFGYAYLFEKAHQLMVHDTSRTPARKAIASSVFLFLFRYALLAITLFSLVYLFKISPTLFLPLFLSSFLGVIYFKQRLNQ